MATGCEAMQPNFRSALHALIAQAFGPSGSLLVSTFPDDNGNVGDGNGGIIGTTTKFMVMLVMVIKLVSIFPDVS